MSDAAILYTRATLPTPVCLPPPGEGWGAVLVWGEENKEEESKAEEIKEEESKEEESKEEECKDKESKEEESK